MSRVGFNVRKKQILQLLDGNEMTAKDVAKELEIAERTARNHLLRYKRQELLDRDGGGFVPGRGRNAYIYTITEKGRDRLGRIETKSYTDKKE